MRHPLAKRLPATLVAFAAVHAALSLFARYEPVDLFIRAGQTLGGQVMNLSGHIVWTESGPFIGDDRTTNILNFAATHGPGVCIKLAAFAAAMATYALVAGPLGRTRLFGYRGPTRCGRCGYGLAGLTRRDGESGLRCPECGTRI